MLVGVKVSVGVRVAVLVGVLVNVGVKVRVLVGVDVCVGLGVTVGVTYSASTDRKWTCPPMARADQVRQPAGTVRIKLLKPAALLLGFCKLAV